MKLIDYIPHIYSNNIEYLSIINSEQDELENKLKPELENIFKNNFIKIANKAGIEEWEKLLNIKSDTDNIEYRRNKLLVQLSSTATLTYKWLEENLKNLVGVNNFYISIDYNSYVININVSKVFDRIAESLYNLYRPLIPANMELVVNLFQTEKTNLYIGAILHEGEIITIQGGQV